MSKEDEKARRNAATLVAAFGLLAVTGVILGLAFMVLGAAISVIFLVVTAMIAIGALQYVTWGWKLDRDRIIEDDDKGQSR